MLAVLLGTWCGARVMWWQYPFAPPVRAEVQAMAQARLETLVEAGEPARLSYPVMLVPSPVSAMMLPRSPATRTVRAERFSQAAPAPWLGSAAPGGLAPGQVDERDPPAPQPMAPAPFLAPARAAPVGRWSLDAWAFWREGSSLSAVSQGRVPVYGASQAGAVLQYRLAPASRHDPRLYLRTYRALVTRGESEAALGGSLRPLGGVPLRVAGELRYTDAAFFTDLRPAAYAVTEIAPLRLPLGTALEVYGQAGWVGGRGATPFADGQASLTRELPVVARLTDDRLRLNFGGGAWGGAQEDAQRVDIGPTLRLDTRIGQVPARVSVDWRLRVAGDASPGSGVAATVSAGF
jgi:hypothetical protein